MMVVIENSTDAIENINAHTGEVLNNAVIAQLILQLMAKDDTASGNSEETLVPGRSLAAVITQLGVRFNLHQLEQLERERLFERIPIACIATDRLFNVVYWNRAAEHLFGYTEQEALQRNLPELVRPAAVSGRAVGDLRSRIAAARGDVHFDAENMTADWRTVHCDWHSKPLLDANNGFAGTLSLVVDKSERTRYEDELFSERRLLRTVIDNMPDSVFVKDASARYLINNKANLELLGVSSEGETIGKSAYDFFDTEIAQRLDQQDRLAIERHATVLNAETRIAYPHAGERWMQTTKVPLHDRSGRTRGILGISRDVTLQKQAEQALRDSEQKFRAAFNQASVGITMTSADMRFLRVNDRFCDLLGYSRDEVLSMKVAEMNLPEELEISSDFRRRVYLGEQDYGSREKQLVRKDGSLVWVLLTTSVIRNDAGEPSHFLSIFQDITESKHTAEALKEKEEQFQQLAQNIPQVFWITDAAQKRIIFISPACKHLLGYDTEQVRARPSLLLRLVHPEDRRRVWYARRHVATQGYDETYRMVKADGSIRWVHDRAFPVRDSGGAIYRIAGIIEDITERKLSEARLAMLAHYDPLTGLPNRVLFYDRLKQVLAHARRKQGIVGVMFVDVDHFKKINDTLGHASGDILLKGVAERMTAAVRTEDTVGRLGGDEFAVVLSGLTQIEDGNRVAQKLITNFAEPFRIGDTELHVTLSIGVTLYPDDGDDADALLKTADVAMYHAKTAGRNGYKFYKPEMNARAFEMLRMENSLRHALARNEFLLYYQPKASVSTGEIIGFEALLRWQHPERGMISPAEFVPMLEETGLIIPVGTWVLEAACRQLKAWEGEGMTGMLVAINLSARQFETKDLGERILSILEKHAVDPHLIEFEITESVLMANADEAKRVLQYLKSLGVGLSIDDFGTGYSSLGYLKRFPLDALKIDASFVRDIVHDADDATITRTVISMAHNMRLKVVAEGVETDAQLHYLAQHGCDQIQGYYVSRPLPAADWSKILARGPLSLFTATGSQLRH